MTAPTDPPADSPLAECISCGHIMPLAVWREGTDHGICILCRHLAEPNRGICSKERGCSCAENGLDFPQRRAAPPKVVEATEADWECSQPGCGKTHREHLAERATASPRPSGGAEERALGNVFMMAKRESRRYAEGTRERESWDHVLRFCRDAGCKDSILRDSEFADAPEEAGFDADELQQIELSVRATREKFETEEEEGNWTATPTLRNEFFAFMHRIEAKAAALRAKAEKEER